MSYDRKAGGAYVSVTSRVRRVSVPKKTLVMEDGTASFSFCCLGKT